MNLLLAALLPAILSPSAVRIQWNPAAGASSGYRVERQKDGGSWEAIGETPLTKFESAGLEPGVLYHHRVCPILTSGCGKWIAIPDARTPSRSRLEQPGELIVSHSAGIPRVDVGSFLEMDGGLSLFLGSFTGTKDVSRSRIARVTSMDGGKTWSSPAILFEEPDVSLLHPALVRMKSGEIGLAYSKLRGGNQAAKVFRYSRNEGKSWSDEIPLSDGSISYMTGASDRLYRLSNDRLVSLVHGKLVNVGGSKEENGRSGLGTDVFISDDNGRSWHKSNAKTLTVNENPFAAEVHEYGFWETGMVECAKGKLLMIGRTATGWAYQSRSDDFGSTWSEPARFRALRNPEAPVYLTMIPGSNDILMLYNPIVDVASGWHLGPRTILAAQISSDQGRTWHGYRELAYSTAGQWFCYPCARWVGNTLHVAYHHWTDFGTSRFVIDTRYQKLSKEVLEGKN